MNSSTACSIPAWMPPLFVRDVRQAEARVMHELLDDGDGVAYARGVIRADGAVLAADPALRVLCMGATSAIGDTALAWAMPTLATTLGLAAARGGTTQQDAHVETIAGDVRIRCWLVADADRNLALSVYLQRQ